MDDGLIFEFDQQVPDSLGSPEAKPHRASVDELDDYLYEIEKEKSMDAFNDCEESSIYEDSFTSSCDGSSTSSWIERSFSWSDTPLGAGLSQQGSWSDQPGWGSVDLDQKPEWSPAEEAIIRSVKNDIRDTCKELGIPADPYIWTTDDVRKWLRRTLQQYCFPVTNLDTFNLDGTNLCMLSENDFVSRSPENGTYLYAQLGPWKYAQRVLSPADCLPSYSELGRAPCRQFCRTEQYSTPIGLQSSAWSHESEPIVTSSRSHTKHNVHLWQFLRELLLEPHRHCNAIKWLDREKGIFKIENSSQVASLWGERKNRPAMNYDKLSRSIRQYYKKGIIRKTENSKRLVYQFCPQYRY